MIKILNNIDDIIEPNFFSYEIDGKLLKTEDSLFNEFASNFEFPDFFGKNWDALYDCLQNLDISNKCKILVRNSDFILSNEKENLDIFFQLIKDIDEYWNDDYEPDEEWGHRAIDFSIYFLFEKSDSEIKNKIQLLCAKIKE